MLHLLLILCESYTLLRYVLRAYAPPRPPRSAIVCKMAAQSERRPVLQQVEIGYEEPVGGAWPSLHRIVLGLGGASHGP